MAEPQFGRLDIGEQWKRLNQTLVDLVDYIPDDKLDWSPQAGMWGFREILSHITSTRGNWLSREGTDREAVLAIVTSKADLTRLLRESWEHVERFLAEQRYVDRVYEGERDGQPYSYSGHWIAFHLLEHDIHHRSDVFHYLALLGIEHPEVGTP